MFGCRRVVLVPQPDMWTGGTRLVAGTGGRRWRVTALFVCRLRISAGARTDICARRGTHGTRGTGTLQRDRISVELSCTDSSLPARRGVRALCAGQSGTTTVCALTPTGMATTFRTFIVGISLLIYVLASGCGAIQRTTVATRKACK